MSALPPKADVAFSALQHGIKADRMRLDDEVRQRSGDERSWRAVQTLAMAFSAGVFVLTDNRTSGRNSLRAVR